MQNGPITLTPLHDTPLPASAWVEKDVQITMRDGTHIAVDVYRPNESSAFPTLYAVSPYRKDLTYLPPTGVYRFRECGDIGWWLSKGYAFVHADVRGSGHSQEGQWQLHGLPEQLDLYDTIEWIAAQAWSNGKVGMTGESYYGALQWFAAQQQPPHLTAIAPYDAFCDTHRDVSYHGGMPGDGFPTWWSYNTRALTLIDQPGPHPEHIMGFDIIGEGLRHLQGTDEDKIFALERLTQVVYADQEMVAMVQRLSESRTQEVQQATYGVLAFLRG